MNYNQNFQLVALDFNLYSVELGSERERQIPYDITFMWNLKYDTNELIYETETDSQM